MCDRYRIAEAMLRADARMSVERIRDIMAAVHQEGPVSTVYSYVVDLQQGKLHLYRFHDFAHAVVLDVRRELAKGSHTLSLQDLFPVSFAADEFAAQSTAALEIMKAGRRYPQFDPATYAEYAGRYVVSRPASMVGVTIVLTAGTDRLLGEISDGGRRELIPESATVFSVWGPQDTHATVRFRRDTAGKVTGFVAETDGGQIVADRPE